MHTRTYILTLTPRAWTGTWRANTCPFTPSPRYADDDATRTVLIMTPYPLSNNPPNLSTYTPDASQNPSQAIHHLCPPERRRGPLRALRLHARLPRRARRLRLGHGQGRGPGQRRRPPTFDGRGRRGGGRARGQRGAVRQGVGQSRGRAAAQRLLLRLLGPARVPHLEVGPLLLRCLYTRV